MDGKGLGWGDQAAIFEEGKTQERLIMTAHITNVADLRRQVTHSERD